MSWKYDVRGELYFNLNQAYASKDDPWKDVYLFGGNGDGTLFYPGKPDRIGGTADIPVESVRLKLIREGLEDYEYIRLFAAEYGAAAAAEIVDRLVRRTYEFERDPAALYGARRSLGEKLHE